jgi:hypothetical protein
VVPATLGSGADIVHCPTSPGRPVTLHATGRRKIVVAGAAAGLVLVAALGLAVALRAPGQLPAGPIKPMPPSGIALVVKVGQKMTDAYIALELGGTKDAVIDRVQPVYVGNAVKTLGAITSDPNRKLGIPLSNYQTWPPKDPRLGVTRPAAGTVVHPYSTGVFATQILIGMQVTRAGHFLRKGFWLYYHVGSEHYRVFFHSEATFCTPSAMQGTVCPFLGGGTSMNPKPPPIHS